MNTLIISATHGNEAFSIPVVKRLKDKYQFDWIIGNPKALKQNTRYFEADLNRVSPGSPKGKLYEERRAATIYKKSLSYQQTIDLHGTIADTGIFIIISDPAWQNIELAKKFDVKNVVLWPSLQPKGPVTQFAKGLELECGPKDSSQVAKELTRILKPFLSGKKRVIKQNFYIVTDKIKQPVKGQTFDGGIKLDQDLSALKGFKDFVETTYQNRTFTPLLVDQYPDIKCYCMQKLDSPLEFNTSNKTK